MTKKHWRFCNRNGLPKAKSSTNVPKIRKEKKFLKTNLKIPWDFTIHTGHHLENNKPDIVLHDKKWSCHTSDATCPFNTQDKN